MRYREGENATQLLPVLLQAKNRESDAGSPRRYKLQFVTPFPTTTRSHAVSVSEGFAPFPRETAGAPGLQGATYFLEAEWPESL